MNILVKTIIYPLFFLITFTLFLPKENIYYFALDKLVEQKVSLEHKSIKEDMVSLDINDVNLKYDNIQTSNIKDIKVQTYLLFNQIKIENISVDPSMKKFVPGTIDKIEMTYSVTDPLKINVFSSFDMGECEGYVDVLNKTVRLELLVSNSFKSKYRQIVKYLTKIDQDKKTKQTRYTYEYKY